MFYVLQCATSLGLCTLVAEDDILVRMEFSKSSYFVSIYSPGGLRFLLLVFLKLFLTIEAVCLLFLVYLFHNSIPKTHLLNQAILASFVDSPTLTLIQRDFVISILSLLPQDVCGTMELFEGVFMRSYSRADGSRPSLSPQTSQLHTNALLSWALLLTICSGSHIRTILHK